MKISRIWEMRKQIEAEQYRLLKLRSAMEQINRPLDGLPPSNSYKSRVEELTVRVIDSEARLKALTEEVPLAQAELTIAILSVDLKVETTAILLMRYVECKTFSEITAELNYSERRIYYLHREGLTRLVEGKAVTL